MESDTKIISRQRGVDTVRDRLKYLIFGRITSKSSNLFLRGTDIISISPQTTGLHEPDLTAFLTSIAEEGSSDFLIDIGANIGLTACQNGKSFERVICFEPNPLCVHILKVNTEISLGSSKVEIHDFGLGQNRQELDLWIPKHNWGGAFIRNPGSTYSDTTLASKDGFERLDPANYTIKQVKIEPVEVALGDLFSRLDDAALRNGAIKIDVEGMELIVLEGIAKSLPPHINVAVVFENWDENFPFQRVRDYFRDRVIRLEKIERSAPYRRSWPGVAKAIVAPFGKRSTYLKEISHCSNNVGAIVLTVR